MVTASKLPWPCRCFISGLPTFILSTRVEPITNWCGFVHEATDGQTTVEQRSGSGRTAWRFLESVIVNARNLEIRVAGRSNAKTTVFTAAQ
jgi:hypothetical protein